MPAMKLNFRCKCISGANTLNYNMHQEMQLHRRYFNDIKSSNPRGQSTAPTSRDAIGWRAIALWCWRLWVRIPDYSPPTTMNSSAFQLPDPHLRTDETWQTLSLASTFPRTVCLLPSRQGEPGLIPGRVTSRFSHVGIVLDDAASRRVFSGLPFPPPFHSGAAPYSPRSPSPAAYSDPRFIFERHTAPTRVIIMASVISNDSRTPLVVTGWTLMARRCVQDIIPQCAFPFLVKFETPILQQNNARTHTARVSLACLRCVNMLPRQASSPDLSSTENVWEQIRHQLRPAASTADLEGQLRKLRQYLPREKMRRLCASMPNRIAACLCATCRNTRTVGNGIFPGKPAHQRQRPTPNTTLIKFGGYSASDRTHFAMVLGERPKRYTNHGPYIQPEIYKVNFANCFITMTRSATDNSTSQFQRAPQLRVEMDVGEISQSRKERRFGNPERKIWYIQLRTQERHSGSMTPGTQSDACVLGDPREVAGYPDECGRRVCRTVIQAEGHYANERVLLVFLSEHQGAAAVAVLLANKTRVEYSSTYAAITFSSYRCKTYGRTRSLSQQQDTYSARSFAVHSEDADVCRQQQGPESLFAGVVPDHCDPDVVGDGLGVVVGVDEDLPSVLGHNVVLFQIPAGAAKDDLEVDSPPTKANRVQSPDGSLPDSHIWGSCRTMPLVGRVFSVISLPLPSHNSVAAPVRSVEWLQDPLTGDEYATADARRVHDEERLPRDLTLGDGHARYDARAQPARCRHKRSTIPELPPRKPPKPRETSLRLTIWRCMKSTLLIPHSGAIKGQSTAPTSRDAIGWRAIALWCWRLWVRIPDYSPPTTMNSSAFQLPDPHLRTDETWQTLSLASTFPRSTQLSFHLCIPAQICYLEWDVPACPWSISEGAIRIPGREISELYYRSAVFCRNVKNHLLVSNTIHNVAACVRAVCLLPSRQGEPGLIPGRVTSTFSHVGIVLDDAASRRVFSGLPFPPPFHSGAAPYSHRSPSPAAYPLVAAYDPLLSTGATDATHASLSWQHVLHEPKCHGMTNPFPGNRSICPVRTHSYLDMAPFGIGEAH
ncbi:hypothetical protein PR048_004358 [Dryococelus australis]|uniref:Uncharacterized protein n=1 Tax=Dryococelus australis TaxID=614101 RepID=A0ABQ9I6C2_9NEOP|nr:hypothetical protein PR048_004358 [Dryococelus australis]